MEVNKLKLEFEQEDKANLLLKSEMESLSDPLNKHFNLIEESERKLSWFTQQNMVFDELKRKIEANKVSLAKKKDSLKKLFSQKQQMLNLLGESNEIVKETKRGTDILSRMQDLSNDRIKELNVKIVEVKMKVMEQEESLIRSSKEIRNKTTEGYSLDFHDSPKDKTELKNKHLDLDIQYIRKKIDRMQRKLENEQLQGANTNELKKNLSKEILYLKSKNDEIRSAIRLAK